MKNFTIFETTIIGFFVGVIVSTYLVFVSSTNGFIGQILNWISLRPLLQYFNISDNNILLYSFLFFVFIYSIYGLIVGVLIKESKRRAIFASLVIIFILGFSVYEQSNGSTSLPADFDNYYPQVATVIKTVEKIPKQYFGNEVYGDLNNDYKNDIAFIIKRNDKDRGMLYYMSTAITIDDGHEGTNLIFLGEKIEPQRIFINNGVIGFEYIDNSSKKINEIATTSVKTIFARLNNGILEQFDPLSVEFDTN